MSPLLTPVIGNTTACLYVKLSVAMSWGMKWYCRGVFVILGMR